MLEEDNFSILTTTCGVGTAFSAACVSYDIIDARIHGCEFRDVMSNHK